MKHSWLWALVMAALPFAYAEAGVYKCVDEDGKVRYTNTGCPGKKAEKVIEQDSGATDDDPGALALQNVEQRCDLDSALILNQHLQTHPDKAMQKRARNAYSRCGNNAREAENAQGARDWEIVRQGGNPYLMPGSGPNIEAMMEKQRQLIEEQERLEQEGPE